MTLSRPEDGQLRLASSLERSIPLSVGPADPLHEFPTVMLSCALDLSRKAWNHRLQHIPSPDNGAPVGEYLAILQATLNLLNPPQPGDTKPFCETRTAILPDGGVRFFIQTVEGLILDPLASLRSESPEAHTLFLGRADEHPLLSLGVESYSARCEFSSRLENAIKGALASRVTGGHPALVLSELSHPEERPLREIAEILLQGLKNSPSPPIFNYADKRRARGLDSSTFSIPSAPPRPISNLCYAKSTLDRRSSVCAVGVGASCSMRRSSRASENL